MKKLLILIALIFFNQNSFSQEGYIPSDENIKAREWFKDARFGLFIHWGVYSVLGDGEWVMNNQNISIEEYEKLPSFFNPVYFDAEEWVLMAKDAGMKYITITSRHHDGFSMFDSKASDYNIVKKTPYGKDVLKMLAEACRKHDLKLFFYYSQLDWYRDDYFPRGRTGNGITGRGEGNWNDYINFMKSFRYPLAGEFSFRRSLIPELRIPSDWGLEVGILSEMQRNQASNRICQVDIADTYDHKHQDLSIADRSKGLSRMSVDISKVIIRKLAAQGYCFGPETIRTIKATYYRQALDMVSFHQADAALNGLSYDMHKEEEAIELFAENIMRAGQDYNYSPMETPFIPSWARVLSAVPDIGYRLRRAVEADNQKLKTAA